MHTVRDMVVPGFRGSGVWCGIKKSGNADLAIVLSERPCTSDVLFTRNKVAAAPVEWGRSLASRSALRGVIVNSGNANACTGKKGRAAVRRISAEVCGALAIPDESLLVSSTGVIGVPLPVEKILAAVSRLCGSLTTKGIPRAGEAILTTDAYPKRGIRTLRIGRKVVTLGGIAKGAGMIAPDMGTMLAYVFTDAAVRTADLRKVFRNAVAVSFHRIVVDGDMSTNDTAAIFANAACGLPPLAGRDLSAFSDVLRQLLLDLALMIVRDGEGATRVVRMSVTGARNDRDAKAAALAVATSPLVKTSVFGADLNWGRVIAAVGRSGAAMEPDRVEMSFAGEKVLRRGMEVDRRAERRAMPKIRKEAYGIDVELGLGKGSHFVFFSDLGHDYIRTNAGYRT